MQNDRMNLTESSELVIPKSDRILYDQDDQATVYLEDRDMEASGLNRLKDLVEIYNEKLSPTVVYLAVDRSDEKKVILKKIIKSDLNFAMHEQARNELEISTELRHYNLVKTYETFENELEYSLIQEFVPQADYFQQKLGSSKRPIKNDDKIQFYMYDILEGLKYMHSQGIVHLDIKPQNLYCLETIQNDAKVRRVKVGDFGLSRRKEADGKVTLKEVCGTYGYMAPEMKVQAHVNEKADIWSLGITLYYMICLYLPHHVKGYKYGEGEVPFRNIDWKKRSPALLNLVKKMLSLDPNERPSAEECQDDVFFQNNLTKLRKQSEVF